MNVLFAIVQATLFAWVSTNEVPIGSATIGQKSFDVVALQVVTNRTVSITHDGVMEVWTNRHEGPFVATNLVERPPFTNWISTTNVWWHGLVPTNTLLLDSQEIRFGPSQTNVTLEVRP